MIKITLIAIICAIIIIYLKGIGSELYQLAIIASGIMLLYFIFSYVGEMYDFFKNLSEMTGIDNSLFKIIFKITAIGYVTEFGAGVIEDFGLKGLSDKLVFCGKIIILVVSMPVFYAVFNLLTEILG